MSTSSLLQSKGKGREPLWGLATLCCGLWWSWLILGGNVEHNTHLLLFSPMLEWGGTLKWLEGLSSLAFLIHFVYLKNQSFFLLLVADLGLVVVLRVFCWISFGWVSAINLGSSFGLDTWWVSVGSLWNWKSLLCFYFFWKTNSFFFKCLSVAWMRDICSLTLF